MSDPITWLVTAICSGLTITSVELLARKNIGGWFVSTANQGFWILINIDNGLYPLLVLNAYMLWVNYRAIKRWKAESIPA